MTIEQARKIAADYLERAQSMGASVEHPETARLANAASVILDLATQLETAQAALIQTAEQHKMLGRWELIEPRGDVQA